MNTENIHYILRAPSDAHHYTAKACLVWCFDARFSGALEAYCNAQKWALRDVDLIKVAGGAKGIASPADEYERAYLLDQIAKSVKLHNPARIVLMVHAECGAYGKHFANIEEEAAFYKAEAQRAKTIVTDYCTKNNIHAEVEGLFADFDGIQAA